MAWPDAHPKVHDSSRPPASRQGRYSVAGGLVAEFDALGLTAAVRDLSRGGFAIGSDARIDLDSHHDVVLRCSSESTPAVPVRVAHITTDHRASTPVVGFQFLHPNAPRLRASLTTIVRTLGCLDDAPST